MLQLVGVSVKIPSLAKAYVCECVCMSVCAHGCNLYEPRCRVCIVPLRTENFQKKIFGGKGLK